DYPSLAEAIADYDADIIEFRPDDDPLEIASLRGSAVRTMIAYNGSSKDMFDRILDIRPDMFNLDDPFKFTRFSQEKFGHGKGNQTQANII
ncbi:MAG: hypothetical protein VW989_13070, partial [Rhodobiaceae bacterium]